MNDVLMEAYQARRNKLIKSLPENSIAILFGAGESVRNNDAHYPFRQTSDFYYLSGVAEPDAVMLFCPGRKSAQTILFSHEKDPKVEQWVGPRIGAKQACELYRFEDAQTLDSLDKLVPELLENVRSLYVDFGSLATTNAKRVFGWLDAVKKKIRSGVNAPTLMGDLSQLIHQQRLIKDDLELSLLRKASEISVEAQLRAMQACKPGMFEYQIEAILMEQFIRSGARYPSYEPIVAGGANACVLHYVDNYAELNDGELLLIDSGCEYGYYAADITRTFPINGKFSSEQKALYDLVLNSQLEAIKLVKPGLRWDAMQQKIVQVLVEGLVELDILKGSVEENIEQKHYEKYYMHKSGHWLGLDVHDVGPYRDDAGEYKELQTHMVFTIEPGLYMSPNDESLAPQWRGIGIRIEDDIAVTASGAEVLTEALPKTTEAIEAVMQ